MQNRKSLTAATLAFSLLSTSAVLALERAPYRLAQAEEPAQLDDQNSGPAAADDDEKKARKKNPTSEKSKANRNRDDRQDGQRDGQRQPAENKSEQSDQKADTGNSKREKPEKGKPPARKADDDRQQPATSDKANDEPAPAQRSNASEGRKPDAAPVAEPKPEGAAPDADAVRGPERKPADARQEEDRTRERRTRSEEKPSGSEDTDAKPERAREADRDPRPDQKPKAEEPAAQPEPERAAPREQPADAAEPAPRATAPTPSTTEESQTERATRRERPSQEPAATDAKDLKQVNESRRQRSEDGGKRIVIEEPDKRAIIKEEGRVIIRHDETERFRRLSRDTRVEKRDGLDISVTVLAGGIQIFTELDDQGRPLRRYRKDRSGREVVLFDNRDYYRRHRGRGSFIDAIIDLPPPRVDIPRQRYIVEYDEASEGDIYEALSAPPVEELERTYALEEVRRSPRLRDRMRRVDLDTIKFEFGSWEVPEDQYRALERAARVINRLIDKNPNEMFLIEGHTDAVGTEEDNLSLSDRRAESVAVILTEEFNVRPENLTTQGYGEQYLKVETDQAEQQNRRVAVRRITPLLARGNR